MMEWTQDLPFSRSYLMIVVGVAVVVGGLAIFGQSSTLALAAAILGLYVLHLFSNWQLASNQRQQWQTLREVERMLGALDSESAHAAVESGGRVNPEATAASDAGSDDGQLTAVGEADSGSAVAEEESAAAAAGGVSAEPAGSGVSAETPGETADVDSDDGAAPPEERAATEEAEGEDEDDTVLVPRQYKLGTVAVVERVLTPGEVARVLAVQDRQPDRQFGDIAVELDLLTETELADLLETQRQGLYRPEAISRARRDLKKFRRRKAEELGAGP